jgi:hypothetical protein
MNSGRHLGTQLAEVGNTPYVIKPMSASQHISHGRYIRRDARTVVETRQHSLIYPGMPFEVEIVHNEPGSYHNDSIPFKQDGAEECSFGVNIGR